MVSRTPHLSWTARTSPSGSNPRGCRSQAKTLVENMGSWSKENVDFTENDGFGMNFIDFLGMEGSCKCSLQVWNIPKKYLLIHSNQLGVGVKSKKKVEANASRPSNFKTTKFLSKTSKNHQKSWAPGTIGLCASFMWLHLPSTSPHQLISQSCRKFLHNGSYNVWPRPYFWCLGLHVGDEIMLCQFVVVRLKSRLVLDNTHSQS